MAIRPMEGTSVRRYTYTNLFCENKVTILSNLEMILDEVPESIRVLQDVHVMRSETIKLLTEKDLIDYSSVGNFGPSLTKRWWEAVNRLGGITYKVHVHYDCGGEQFACFQNKREAWKYVQEYQRRTDAILIQVVEVLPQAEPTQIWLWEQPPSKRKITLHGRWKTEGSTARLWAQVEYAHLALEIKHKWQTSFPDVNIHIKGL
jgi:hypothetical protein